MAKKPVLKVKKPLGRSKIPIDWAVVDKCLMTGSSGTETAAFIGVHPDTLYLRCVEKNKMLFSAYTQIQRQKGNSFLLGKQYQVAMGGNVSMLIWLGKQRLAQTDQPKDTEEFNGSLASLLGIMHMIKSPDDFTKLVQLANKKAAEKLDIVEEVNE